MISFEFAERAAGLSASLCASAPCYRFPEDIRVVPIVVSELELRNIQRHIFGADLVEAADNATLEDRPEAFNRVRVDRANNVLAVAVLHGEVREILPEVAVSAALIGSQQTNLIGNSLSDETLYGLASDVPQDARHHVALAAYRADHRDFAGASAATSAAALIPMLVLVLAADPSLIDLDDAAKLGFRLDERGADFVAHGQGGFVGAEAEHPLDLQGAHPLLAGQHQVNDPEPVTERLIRILEDGPRDHGEAIAGARSAFVALPFERHGADREHLLVPAAGAPDAFRPAALHQIGFAGFLIGEHVLELAGRHLRNGLGAAHGSLLSTGEIMA